MSETNLFWSHLLEPLTGGPTKPVSAIYNRQQIVELQEIDNFAEYFSKFC